MYTFAYNLYVPTPFYHLSIACQIQDHPSLNPKIQTMLKKHSSDFLLGKTAPDVQVVSRQAREATHFYTLPPEDSTPAWKRLMASHPSLANSQELSPQQAVFIAGYICHLQADEQWIFDVFMPVFGPDALWADFRERLYLHNVMRAYVDQQVLATLPEDMGVKLLNSRPDNWLPFVEDKYLLEWQSHVAEQLQPDAEIQTAAVFAERQGLLPEDFTNLIESEDKMDEVIFSQMPRERLTEFRETLVAKNLQLIEEYLAID